MGYLHIDNLYKNQQILMHPECYALEKIHGTSAHVAWRDGQVHLFSGGEKHERFAALFDVAALVVVFAGLGRPRVTVYGEAYGGSQQKQAHRYGPDLRFVAFDVLIGDDSKEATGEWLDVPSAHAFVSNLGLEFVHYERVSTNLVVLDAQRDAPSAQARRNGVIGDKPREGVVLRPLVEAKDRFGNRIIAKHKRDDERETATPRKVVDTSKIEVLTKAAAIADEWVTETRLDHVLDHLAAAGGEVGIERTRDVIAAMQKDVLREGAGEIVDSHAARAAIGKKTAEMFKTRLRAALGSGLER